MSTYRLRLALLVALLGLVPGLAAPAHAQEWKIYMLGKPAPIVASFYAEEAPWVFYRDDESMYVFAVGCNRIKRVERGGTEIPPPACPVERVPTNVTRVYIAVLDLEGKRLDDAFERLRGITVQFNRAAADATITLGNARAIGGAVPVEGIADALRTLKVQLDDVRLDLDESLRRSGALIDAVEQQRRVEREMLARPRYFFAPR